MDQPRAFSDALPPHVSAAARELADFTQFAEILRRHLAEVSQTTEAAGMDILTRLIEIENAIHTLVAHVGIAVEAGPVVAAVTQTMEGMKASQDIVARMKSDLDANAEKAAARLTAVKSRAAALDDLVEAVRRVAKQTYFLSINASIEATRAGQSAGGFAIVAKEVRELSKEVEDVSNKIGDGITALASSLDETLTSVVADHHRREVENFSALSATFTHVGTCVANIMTHQGLLLAEVKRQGEALVQPINALAASIQFQDITRQQLGHVDTSLCNMAGHYVDLAKALRSGTALPVGNVTQYIDEMYSGYVMQQQRDAHGSADTGPGKVIELF